MKINLKYLVLLILIPLSVMASDTEKDLDNISRANRLDAATPCSDLTDTSNSPTAITTNNEIEPASTFTHARHVWFFGNEKERDLARPILYHFIQDKKSGDYFGKSRALILAPHLLQSTNKKDREIAADYFKTVYFDKSHKDHQNLDDLLTQDASFKNKLGDIIFKYFT
jgi:hypothetical protein